MMDVQIKIPYGQKNKTIQLSDNNLIKVILPKETKSNLTERELIFSALNNPIHSLTLGQIAKTKKAKTAVIVINDITRPTPTKKMLESIINELNQVNISKDDITLLVATGNHRPPTSNELIEMVGKEFKSSMRIVNHDAGNKKNLIYLGETSRKVPIWVNKEYMKADLKILTGTISPHHSAGFSGGRKSILPGISGLKSLNIHHSFPIRPFYPALGWYHGNPFHEESLEAAQIAGVDFIVNSIYNIEGDVIKVVAGDLDKAHYEGVKICKDIWTVKVPEMSNITIVSPGGYPRDINLHQSQKAISCGELITKPGGIIILIAECSKGIGKFQNWLIKAKKPEDVILRFKKIGYTEEASSKAFMFARALLKYKLFVISDYLKQENLKEMFLTKMNSSNEALDFAFKELGKDSKVLVVPKASDIIPKLEKDK